MMHAAQTTAWQIFAAAPAQPNSKTADVAMAQDPASIARALAEDQGEPCSSGPVASQLSAAPQLHRAADGTLVPEVLRLCCWLPCTHRNTSHLLLCLPLHSCQLLQSTAKWQRRCHPLVLSSSRLWGSLLLLLLLTCSGIMSVEAALQGGLARAFSWVGLKA